MLRTLTLAALATALLYAPGCKPSGTAAPENAQAPAGPVPPSQTDMPDMPAWASRLPVLNPGHRISTPDLAPGTATELTPQQLKEVCPQATPGTRAVAVGALNFPDARVVLVAVQNETPIELEVLEYTLWASLPGPGGFQAVQLPNVQAVGGGIHRYATLRWDPAHPMISFNVEVYAHEDGQPRRATREATHEYGLQPNGTWEAAVRQGQ